MKLSPIQIKNAKDYYEMFIGFNLTDEQFLEIAESDSELLEDISGGADTMNREWFMGLLAKKITGRDWPKYNSSPIIWDQFSVEMRINGQAMGYAVPNNFGSDE